MFGAWDRRDPRARAAAGTSGYPAASSRRRIRRLAVHTESPDIASAVLQYGAGQRPDHGNLASDRRPHARPAGVQTRARACWSVGLAFIHPGISGIVLI